MKTVAITEFAPLSSTPGLAPVTAAPEIIDPKQVRSLIAKAHAERNRAMSAAIFALFAALGAYPRKLWASFTSRRLLQRNINALNGLDDRMLKDMGIDRGQIVGVVHNAVTGFQPEPLMYEVRSPANSLKRVIAA